jgi:hypothetical protein
MSKIQTTRAVPSADRQRTRLLVAIAKLSSRDGNLLIAERLALAEGEFRLAELPGTDPVESIENLRRAVAHDPIHPKFHFHLGLALHRTGDCRGAVFCYRAALQLAPASQRTLIHLALALTELKDPEKKLGEELMEALCQGQSTKELMVQVDDALKAYLEPPSGQRPQAASKKKLESASKNKPAAALPGEPCHWEGVWRVSLLHHLARFKPFNKQIDKRFDHFTDSNDAINFALGCLQLLVAGEPVEAVRRRMNADLLKSHSDQPAMQLLEAALRVASQPNPQSFVTAAVEAIHKEELPQDLVCWLHFAAYGSGGSLPAGEALEAVELYPREWLREPSFVELRIAILEGYARRAWNAGELDLARLLWNEVLAMDPHRTAVAHNLALLAARTRSVAEYPGAWDYAAALRYLHAAAAGDPRLGLEDRRSLHLSLAQQVKQRYFPAKNLSDEAQSAQLRAWLMDRDALDTYLAEWDLYYVASRLSFRSPVHLLGIAKDASPELTVFARVSLLAKIRQCFEGLRWPGVKTFVKTAEDAVEAAFEHASVNLERARDPYYQQEKPEADQLIDESIQHCSTLNVLLIEIIQDDVPEKLDLALRIGRRLFTLPWKVLEPICTARGQVSEDNKTVVDIFERHLLAAAAGGLREPDNDADAAGQLEQLELCCRLTERSQKETSTLRHNLAAMIDSAAFKLIPEDLLQPKDLAQAEKFLAEGRKALEKFPRACGLRMTLVKLLKQIGDPAKLDEAVQLLEAGRPLAFVDEQKASLEETLKEIQDAVPKARASADIRELLESASAEMSTAIDELNRRQTPEAVENVGKAATRALEKIDRAAELAGKSELADLEQQASKLRGQIAEFARKIRER